MIIITSSSLDSGDRMQILIVEDDHLVALALKMVLAEGLGQFARPGS
jgi:hypothetical protein